MSDTRYCYSTSCSWHGPIKAVGKIPSDKGFNLPCCPFCSSTLFEIPSKEEWDTGAKPHESEGRLNYVDFLEWTKTQSRCWPSLREAAIDFKKESGKRVVWDL